MKKKKKAAKRRTLLPVAVRLFTDLFLYRIKLRILDESALVILFFVFLFPLFPSYPCPLPPFSSAWQVLLQQADITQNQRETFHLQVQLQQGGASQLPPLGHGEHALLSGPEPLQRRHHSPGLHPRGMMGK